MHTIVAVKQVPDTTNVRVNPETGTLIREGVPAILNPYDVHALEAAVRLKEQYGGKVTVLSMGPPKASDALLECVEQGADRGILLTDRKFAGADTLATSYVIAESIRAIAVSEPVDIVLFGKQAIDGDTAQVGPGVATRLGMPLITNAIAIESVDLEGRTAIVHRKTERGIEVLKTALPFLLTAEKELAQIGRAPLANFIKAARYKPEVWTAAEPVAFDTNAIGIRGSPTIVGKAFTPPPSQPGEKVVVAEKGVRETVAYALEQINKSGVLPVAEPPAGAQGGAV
jgi:electron transfer flavoprotein beta subunit